MILALFAAGIIGFGNFESLKFTDAFHTTVAALTFSSSSLGFSEQGKLLNSALTIASVAVIVWAFVNFQSAGHDVQHAEDFFKFMPQEEGLALKEVKVAKKSHLAGLRKIEVLQRTGTVVMGIKKGGVFELNVPMNRKLAAGTKALFLGAPSQLKEVEKEAKK